MKQIITLCLAVFFIVGIQNVQAQSKEETIEWLNTNGRDFLYVTNTYIVNSSSGATVTDKYYLNETKNDTLIFKDENYSSTGTTTGFRRLPFKSILYQDVNTITIQEDDKNPEIVYFKLKTEPYKTLWISYDGKHQESSDFSTTLWIPYYKKNEENVKRTLKAIMHLAKLSGAKENKQTF